MKVPREVREVTRPAKTVVYGYVDKNGDVRYGVKERTYWKENGKQHQKDGPTIGHIESGMFISLPEDPIPPISYAESDMLSWGQYQLIVNRTQDIRDDLLQVYNIADAEKIYALAVLRTAESGLKDYEAKDAYENSYLRILYPGVALGRDTISELLHNLGRTCTRITKFMVGRVAKVPANHLVAMDGMLKSYEGEDSFLSDFSHKALKTGTRDVSVMMAYDVDVMEPVCANVYPGNLTDKAVFRDFIESNRVHRGVVITDRGFKYGSAKQVFLDNPDLHFLIPLDRDSKVIDEYNVLCTDRTLANRPAVAGRKVRMHDGRFLYGYRDTDRAVNEEKAWLSKHRDYDPTELESRRRVFGSIVFVCDLDAPLETVYAAYEERWEVEVLFRFYKRILTLDETRVESDQSVIGTEFINFLSMIMMCRLRKAFHEVECLRGRSFRYNMKLLNKGVMMRDTPASEWRPKKLTRKQEDAFIELGIIERPQAIKRKVGRPKGSKNKPKVQ
ncbi:MAG: transposase [Candidatus Methanomethylophilaceae archaeon]|nr:transposase [Candidatus Methanomethylophilaceae archaeon]